MTKIEFDRFQYLSEKVIKDIATSDEFVEFHQLLKEWNQEEEFKLISKSNILSLKEN